MARSEGVSKLLPTLFTFILGNVTTPALAFEELGEVSLEAMEKPSPLMPGTEVHWLKEGKEFIQYYESVDEELQTVRGDDGCRWTRMTYMFAPALSYDNCYGTSGTQTIVETKGSPWPLTEQTEFQYSFTGKYKDNLGNPWRSTWKCKVDNQVKVKVPAGEYDTYKMVCEDDFMKRTYWISPELGHYVAVDENHKIYISQWFMLELVRVVNP